MNNQFITDFCQDAVIVSDLKGVITYCNESARKLLEYEEGELEGKDYEVITTNNDTLSFQEVKEFILFNQTVPPFASTRRTKSDKLEAVIIQYSTVKDHDGNLLGISSFFRKPSLFEKTASNAQALLETAPDSMIIVNDRGQIVFINNQTELLFGYSRHELLGNKIEKLIPDEYKNHKNNRDKYIANHKPRSMGQGAELFGKTKDNKKIPVEISLSPLQTKDGLFVSAAIRDITDRKKIEKRLENFNQELQTKNKDLEQFAFVSSHDLQEPLKTVLGFLPLLKEEYESVINEDGKLYLGFIEDACNRMSESVVSLLEYSRIGRNSELEKVDTNLILNDVLKDLKNSIEISSAEITVDQLPEIKGFKTELRLVFQNLLTNAIKFRKKDKNPIIHISAEKKGPEWEFTIKDNGIGIEEKFQDKIFIIFQRLHNRKNYSGSGIGLAHCRKIVELHGGAIWVESKADLGSEFKFTIPISRSSII